MSLKQKLAVPLIVSSLTTSALAQSTLYDDFSSGTLNTLLWQESSQAPYPDFHGIDQVRQTYRVIQNTMGDRGVVLTPTSTFNAGDIFEYDVIYNAGTGNHLFQLFHNGGYNGSVNPNPTPISGSIGIGYWNQTPDASNGLGTYHFEHDFLENGQILETVTRPDHSIRQYTISNLSEPYTLGLNVHTGHNGLMDFEIDNVYISQIPSPAPIGLLGLAGIAVSRRKR